MTRTIQMVVLVLGATVLLVTGGLIILSVVKVPVPEALAGLGGTALGALSALLTGHRVTDFTGPTRADDFIRPAEIEVKPTVKKETDSE